jgi:hypothetical protein
MAKNRLPLEGKALERHLAKLPRWMQRYRARLTRTVPAWETDAAGNVVEVRIPYSEWRQRFGAGGSFTGPRAVAAHQGAGGRKEQSRRLPEPSPSPEDPFSAAKPPSLQWVG